jgi:hypothetical protein
VRLVRPLQLSEPAGRLFLVVQEEDLKEIERPAEDFVGRELGA